MNCANCGTPARPGELCPRCGTLQPAPVYGGGYAAQPGTAAARGQYYTPYQPTVPMYPSAPSTNGLAIASLVCALTGLFICPVGLVLGPIFGFVARGQIRRSGGAQTGNGLALAGIIVGLVAIVLAIIVVVIFIGLAANTSGQSGGA